MACGLALTAAGIIPADCASYDVVWQYLMPGAAAAYMLETDLTALAASPDSAHLLRAFLLGALGMMAGALAGWWLLAPHLGPDGGKLCACLCASYIGGSVNFAAVAKATSLAGASVPVAMAADNLMMAAYLAVLISIRTATAAASSQVTASASQTSSVASPGDTGSEQAAADSQPVSLGANGVTAESMAVIMAGMAFSCCAGKWAAGALGLSSLTLMFTALVAASCAMAGNRLLRASPGQPSPFAGASQMGGALMSLFFAIIGCSAGSFAALQQAGGQALAMCAFLTVMVGVHWAWLWLTATRLLRLPLPAVIIASNACIGGPATSAAMAASKKWGALVQPGMLVGSLGYALGTAAGLAVARMAGLAIQ